MDFSAVQAAFAVGTTDVNAAIPMIIGFMVVFMVGRKLIGLFS